MQLVAYGAQDIYLTGNPQITFFKVVYRRHTNFSMESIEQTFNGSHGFGGQATAVVSRNGDLVYKMWVEHTHTNPQDAAMGDGRTKTLVSTAGNAMTSNFGAAFIKEVELEIGGQTIDRHYGHWLGCYHELTNSNPGRVNGSLTETGSVVGDYGNSGGAYGALLNEGTCQFGATQADETYGMGRGSSTVALEQHFYSPLQFWFCRNPGLALPLIALQYHEVKVKVTFEDESLIKNGTSSATENKLWVDYIYLDTDERRRFAQVSHEYLIEQLQYQTVSGHTMTSKSIDLHFNHPVKELIWQVKEASRVNAAMTDATAWADNSAFNQQACGAEIVGGSFGLKLNGQDRFKSQDYKYFTRWQPSNYHTGGGVIKQDSIAVYSFALKPEEHQPSGTCNFSRIDSAQLNVDNSISLGGDGPSPYDPLAANTSITYNIYAVNYNVLRIMSGMGGLAYSN